MAQAKPSGPKKSGPKRNDAFPLHYFLDQAHQDEILYTKLLKSWKEGSSPDFPQQPTNNGTQKDTDQENKGKNNDAQDGDSRSSSDELNPSDENSGNGDDDGSSG